LVEDLSKRFPRLDDPHFVPTAVEDALLSYFDKPEQFDPQKGLSLFAYLRMSANGDILTEHEKSAIRKRVEAASHQGSTQSFQ